MNHTNVIPFEGREETSFRAAVQNVIERAVILTSGDVLRMPALSQAHADPVTLKDAERTHIRRTLDAANWVVGGPEGAAARLGMKRTTPISKIQRMGIRKGAISSE